MKITEEQFKIAHAAFYANDGSWTDALRSAIAALPESPAVPLMVKALEAVDNLASFAQCMSWNEASVDMDQLMEHAREADKAIQAALSAAREE